MSQLWLTLVVSDPSINKIIMPDIERLLYPVNSLKPDQFNTASIITQLANQSLHPSGTNRFFADQLSNYLDILCLRINLLNEIDLRFVNMPVWIMLQKIPESINIQFL